MYCAGAPATHYFPVSIPYHGCALNITVQSYLDQLDFGLVACSETVPDAQRIADFIVEDFAAMREANTLQGRPEAVDAITSSRETASPLLRKPIGLADANAELRTSKVDQRTALTRNVEALSAATEALLRQLDSARVHAAIAAQGPAPRSKAKQRKPASVPHAVNRAAKSEPPALAPLASHRSSAKRRAAEGVEVSR